MVYDTERYQELLNSFSYFADLNPRDAYRFDVGNPDEKELARLRKTYPLDMAVGKGDELRRLTRLARWVYLCIPNTGVPLNAPLHTWGTAELMASWRSGLRLNCAGRATVLRDCYLALGWTSRIVACMPADPRDLECHVVTEVFARSLKKWIAMDGSIGVSLSNGTRPLGLLEFRELLRRSDWSVLDSYQRYMSKNVFMFVFVCRFEVSPYETPRPCTECLLCPVGYDEIARRDSRYRKMCISTNSREFWQEPS